METIKSKDAPSEGFSGESLTNMMNKSIGNLVEDFIKIALSDFRSAKSIVTVALKQKGRGPIRLKYEREGLHIPPFMIASITTTCNLRCKGCYDREKAHSHKCNHDNARNQELNENDWADVFEQAKALGISFILLAGGEPLTKGEIIKQCIKFPEIIFPMFTNGMLIDEEWVKYFASSRNLIPIVSIEGDKLQTNERRGQGVFERVSSNLDLLRKKNIFYGLSITVTKDNFETVLSEDYIKEYVDEGSRLFFFIEYIPFDASTKELVMTEEQRSELDNRLNKLRDNFKGIFLSFPGDEKAFGGCLAAGRGFVHINSIGAMEPCPFSPYSDVSLKNMTLQEALKSPLLQKIRDKQVFLEENEGGCVLFENREIIEQLIVES